MDGKAQHNYHCVDQIRWTGILPVIPMIDEDQVCSYCVYRLIENQWHLPTEAICVLAARFDLNCNDNQNCMSSSS